MNALDVKKSIDALANQMNFLSFFKKRIGKVFLHRQTILYSGGGTVMTLGKRSSWYCRSRIGGEVSIAFRRVVDMDEEVV